MEVGRETFELKIGYHARYGRPQPGGTPPAVFQVMRCTRPEEGAGHMGDLKFSFLGFFSLRFIYYFVCESVLITRMSMYHRCAQASEWRLWQSEEGVRSPGTAVVNGCEKSPRILCKTKHSCPPANPSALFPPFKP